MQHRGPSKTVRKDRKRSTDKMVRPARSIEGSLQRAVGEAPRDDLTNPAFVLPVFEPEAESAEAEDPGPPTMPLMRLGED